MFENLKRIAMQRLAEKMAGNALNDAATGAAAEEGAGALLSSIKEKISSGNLDEIKDLFSGGSENMESNGLFQNAKAKLEEVLQSKGMSAEEAKAEAENTAPDLINGLKERFQSQDAADSEFNLDDISKWIPGNAGDLINKAKNLLG